MEISGFLADLGGPRPPPGHGKATGQQHDGVEATQLQAKGIAAGGKRGEIDVAVQRVGPA